MQNAHPRLSCLLLGHSGFNYIFVVVVCSGILMLLFDTPGISRCLSTFSTLFSSIRTGSPVAQWVKRWPTDLAVLSSSPA